MSNSLASEVTRSNIFELLTLGKLKLLRVIQIMSTSPFILDNPDILKKVASSTIRRAATYCEREVGHEVKFKQYTLS